MKDLKQGEPKFQAILKDIEYICQEADQSREQTCSPMMDQPISTYQSLSPSRSQLKVTTITQKLSQSIVKIGDKVVVSTPNQYYVQKNIFDEIHQLKQINKKLFEDNHNLMKQCIRLKKINVERSQFFENNEKLRIIQLQNIDNLNQINILKAQNLKLKSCLCNYNSMDEFRVLPKFIQQQFLSLQQSIEQIKQKIRNFRIKNLKSSTIHQTQRFKYIDIKKYTLESDLPQTKDKCQKVKKITNKNIRFRQQSPIVIKPKLRHKQLL